MDENTRNSNIYTIPECGHKFHTNCALNWYRISCEANCPLCRSTTNLGMFERKGRIKLFKKIARKKTCPSVVKTACCKLKKEETNLVNIKKEMKAFKAANKEVLQCWKKKLTKSYRIRRHCRRAEIAFDSIPTLILIQNLGRLM